MKTYCLNQHVSFLRFIAVSAVLFAFLIAIFLPVRVWADLPTSARAERAIRAMSPDLTIQLAKKNLKFGAPVFVRIFKQPGVLEIWLENDGGSYQHFKTYDICTFSGDLGPKLRQGDQQSPEGFYFVAGERLNPWSRFH